MTPSDTSQRPRRMSLWDVVAIGIGSMVGAGIFALMGEIAARAGSAVYLSFVIAGVVAVLSGYSYARLSSVFPSSGGIVDFLERGMGAGAVSGTMSLMYLVTVVVSTAVVAKAFGAYAARLASGWDQAPWLANAFGSAIVLALAYVNMAGSAAAGRAEMLLVGIKLAILGVLVVGGASQLHVEYLGTDHYGTPTNIVAGAGLAFFAYAGYGMMANAGGSVDEPRRTIPLAITIAIGSVCVLYIVLAVVVLGTLTPEQLETYRDTAVAEAARPALGDLGFVLVSIAALLATASAVNANLFTGLNVTSALSASGALAKAFNRPIWGRGTLGLILIVVATLALLNFSGLGAIASLGSAAFLLTYLAVQAAHWNLADRTAGSRFLIIAGSLAIAAVLAVLLVQQWHDQRQVLYEFVGFLVLCWLTQDIMRRLTRSASDPGRSPRPSAN
ncbi:MAG: APC family permease [Geminicoccaceae bacterium]